MIKDLLRELKNSLLSILPIYFLVLFLILIRVISLTGTEIGAFSMATGFVILGLTLFNYGAEHAMKPIGQLVGRGLTKKGKILILILAVFLFGFVITISEPDLSVLANQTSSIFNRWLLIIMVSVSVGLFLVLAIIKIIKRVNLPQLLCTFYLFTFALIGILCYQGKENMLGLIFDSGGVTTGPMTVPFIMAIGAGVSSILAKRSEKDASFGFIAFSSIGPIIVVLLLSLFSKPATTYTVTLTDNSNLFASFWSSCCSNFLTVGESVGIILVCFFIVILRC